MTIPSPNLFKITRFHRGIDPRTPNQCHRANSLKGLPASDPEESFLRNNMLNPAYHVFEKDIAALSEELAKGQILCSEDFIKDVYLDAIIKKPWGHEYRIYADMLLDVWKLLLTLGQATSMHCHPRKETILLCLTGRLQINFLSRITLVEAGQFVRISKGVFHTTTNVGDIDAHLIEVETPRNKFDLIRMKDRYGRQSQQYETEKSSIEIPELHRVPINPYAKIRHQDLEGLFVFDILTGVQIKKRNQLPYFSISVSMEAVINQKIDVFRDNAEDSQKMMPDMHYLILRRIRSY